ASGHVGGFADPMVDCKKCRRRFRGDKVYFLRFPAPVGITYMGGFEADNKTDAEKVITDRMAKAARHRDEIPQVAMTERGNLTIISALELFEVLSQQQDPSVIPQPDTLGAGMCPALGCGGQLTPPRSFNLMFQTYVGAIQLEENIAYLRPETA